ncbi:hypothetical protein OED52_08385 [Rhodococcus sp. Z13]|uniref:Uncharacterized protein n=1 Tax=Rhodococcus sacchari TaxID=2962047 RepID=A0ACD4DKG4_9NOCA|nr:serine hydrolase [Rhodococcus sp. Z13]UYP20525.1 hypothetical protein OED52_08385 [Rhodococcus sp. Z13]
MAATVVASWATSAAPQGFGPEALAVAPTAESATADTSLVPSMDALPRRIEAAVAAAADRGADLIVAVLDRETGARVVGGGDAPVATASVVKLFIAEEVLYREALGEATLGEEDHELIRSMLRSSDDSAASLLWDLYGGPEIVEHVVERHRLTGTAPPVPGTGWWNTTTTASDLLTWYDDLLGGSALGAQATARIVGHLMEYTDEGVDGYDQRFGLPDGLDDDASELGVKQGWMCCVDGRWMHLSTGFFGDDHRFVVVAAAQESVLYDESDPLYETGFLPDTGVYDATEDGSAEHARRTLTLAVETAFGSGARP